MLQNRPFQMIVSLLIALGMHVCCCQVAMFSAPDDSSAASPACHGQDGHCHGDDQSPESPVESPHDCCGVHDKPLTWQTSKLQVPPMTLETILPLLWADVDLCGSEVTAPPTESVAPGLDTSLLRRHCALVI